MNNSNHYYINVFCVVLGFFTCQKKKKKILSNLGYIKTQKLLWKMNLKI